MPKTKPTTVPEYINAAAPAARKKLREIRAILKKVAPKATETLKWGSPVFEEKRILFSYSAFKSHLNFMPTRSSITPLKICSRITRPEKIRSNFHMINHCQRRSFARSRLSGSGKNAGLECRLNARFKGRFNAGSMQVKCR